MKRKFLFVLTFVFSFFLFSSSISATPEDVILLEQGASIRTRTQTSDQGLRFTARLDERYKDNEHGFYLVFGETTVDALQQAIDSQTKPIIVNDKEVFKVQVEGLKISSLGVGLEEEVAETMGTYSIVLTGIPDEGYLDGLSAIPYVVIDGVEHFSKAPLTRSIAEVAVALQNSEYSDPAYDEIVNSVSDYRRLIADNRGRLRVHSGIGEVDIKNIRNEFIRDWNQMFGTRLNGFDAAEFYEEALKPTNAEEIGDVIFNETNFHRFFVTNKWSWVIELIRELGVDNEDLMRQIDIIVEYGGFNPFGDSANALKNIVYSVANFFNQTSEGEEEGIAIGFANPSQYDLLEQFNKTVIINPKNYRNIYKGNQGIIIPPIDENLIPRGYRFTHYLVNGENVTAGAIVENLNDNDIIEPTFEPTNYNLRFFDGLTELDNLRATYNIEKTVIFPVPEKQNFNFVGWYDNPEFNGQPIEQLREGNIGHINFYAKWEPAGLTDLQKVLEASDALEIEFTGTDSLNSVINNVTLPKAGQHSAVITWATSDSSIIDIQGVVRRYAEDKTVTLTATISLNNESIIKQFELVVKKFDSTQEYTITFNLNGGAWPTGEATTGYTDRTKMVTDFLTDFYNFVKPAGVSLTDFIHGAGKTSGFDGMYGLYDTNKTDHFDKLYNVNSKGVDASSDKFINQPEYNKWVPLIDVLEEYTNLGIDDKGVQQTFWGSKFIGARRIVPFMQEAKPVGAWNHIPIEDVKAITSTIPEALKSSTPGVSIEVPTKYTPATNDIILPIPEKTGDTFIGWYDNAAYQGSSITKLSKGSTGNKTYYARYESTEVAYTITFNLNGGAFASGVTVPSKYNSGNQAITLPIPTRSGYEFVGWYNNPNFTGSSVFVIAANSTENFAFYAKWEAESDLTDSEKVLDAKNSLDITFASGDSISKVTKPVTLQTSGMHNATITWATSNSNVITNKGVVTRTTTDQTVTLTATIKVGAETLTKTFTLTVLKEAAVDPNEEFTITFNLNGGAWPSGGYANKAAMTTAFLTDLYNFVKPTENLTTFMHGSGKTSGFAGTWYSNEEYRAKIYLANVKSGNNEYFLSHTNYQAKWKPFADFLDEMVHRYNDEQNFWGSTYTGNLRLSQYFANVKPAPNWTDEDMASIPSGLKSFTAPKIYKATDEIVLPNPTKSGDQFIGWYDNANLWGEKITKIEKGSSGNKTFYARYNSSVPIDPSLTNEQRVNEAKAALNIGYASGDTISKVTKPVSLPKTGLHGTTIKWASSDTSTINGSGNVVRKQIDTKVTLTATITAGSVTDTKVFTLTVLKVESYTIKYNLNGGAFAGYTNKTQLATGFLTDLYNFVKPSENLTTFMHGSGKTSGFNGTWYSNEDYRAKIYGANIKSGNNNYFLSHSSYQAKWKPLADFMVNFVKVGNADQDFWSSTYTGNLRLSQYLTNVKPGAAWTDVDMAKLPTGLSANVAYEYASGSLPMTLPTVSRSGYTFEGWYENANFTGSKVTTIAKGETGNKTYYAKWSQPIYTITLNLNGGSLSKLNKSQLTNAFLNDLYSFIRPSENLTTFKHGSSTSGFNGTWFTNDEHRNKIYGVNIKSGNNDYFLSSSLYQAKWAPLATFMESFVKVGNAEQSFWGSPYTGTLRLNQYFRGVKPSSAWTNANMSATPGVIHPKQYSGGSQSIILPNATRSGYTFEGWYTANTGGSKVTSIAANSTGNKTYYARWKKVETPPPSTFPTPSIYRSYTKNNAAYRANRWITVQGVVIHSTAAPGVMARAWISRHNVATNIGVHVWVDNKEAVQTLPWTMRGWHAGGSANNTHIGMEICEPAGHYYRGSTMVNYNISANAAYFNAAYRNAVGLTIYLLRTYGIRTVNVTTVPGHSELGSRGSSSADPMHWFPKHGKSMTTFRNDVRNNL